MGLEYLGLVPLSLVDYPGGTAAVIFTAGCPLACPYCHNPQLIGFGYPETFLPRSEILIFLETRKKLLTGVVITGGEPTIHRELGKLMDDIWSLGFPIKLDTSGIYPRGLNSVLPHPGLHWVALDLKTIPEDYQKLGAGPDGGKKVLESLELLRHWQIPGTRDYELRTVNAPGIVDEFIIQSLKEKLLPGERWKLNPFRPLEKKL